MKYMFTYISINVENILVALTLNGREYNMLIIGKIWQKLKIHIIILLRLSRLSSCKLQSVHMYIEILRSAFGAKKLNVVYINNAFHYFIIILNQFVFVPQLLRQISFDFMIAIIFRRTIIFRYNNNKYFWQARTQDGS
jgi:hypothetical protein